MFRWMKFIVLFFIPIFISFFFVFPRYTDQDDFLLWQEYRSIKDDRLSVMTFNIRFDGVERDPNNHFTKRVFRLTETIEKWQPMIFGVQEPFTDQLRHWQSHLSDYYQSIGYERDPQFKYSNQVAILYNKQHLTLLENDYFWLSKTPRTPESKDWDSGSPRALNIARFQLHDHRINLLVFNTHLDVRGEQARQEQAKIVRSTIQQWHKKYPSALVLLLGDFNSIPQQSAYEILTFSDFLHDTWVICKANNATCRSNVFSSTFHGWLGSFLHTYVAQILQSILFTFHGSGVKLPYQMPARLSSYIDVITDLFHSLQLFQWSKMVSLWSEHRFHVDWILHQHSLDQTHSLETRFIAVIDVRSYNYSSDHFPVIALFDINK